MIGGFEQPTSGLIELAGVDVTWLPPYQRHVNTVFQNYALFPHLTIWENVAFGLSARASRTRRSRRRVTEMLELVELPGFEKRKPTQISGGQAQRVALARALINRPAVLLLDEPLGALDLKLRKQMQVELKRIQQEVGITFIYVTHDQEEAMTMSDRIAVMNKGKYEQLGDPETLYERPTTRFVAGFLGVSNLLARQVPTGRRTATRSSSWPTASPVRVPTAARRRPYPGRRRRPAREDPHPRGGFRRRPAGPTRWPGTVTDASYIGVSTQYIVETRSGTRVVVYEQNIERAIEVRAVEPGRRGDPRLVPGPHVRRRRDRGAGRRTRRTDRTTGGGLPGGSRHTHLDTDQPPPRAGRAAPSPAWPPSSPRAARREPRRAPPSAAPDRARRPRPRRPAASAGERQRRQRAPAATASPELNWANWTYYMDVDPNDQTKHPTLEAFTAKYGTVVHYQEVIDGNDEFVAKIADAAKAGKDTGWDLITLTDWMAAKLIRRGWVDAFDMANVPNLIANLKDVYRNLEWDPDNSHHAPWRSGTTGLGFNSDVTGDVTSLAALYTVDPKTKGKVEYLTEMRDADRALDAVPRARPGERRPGTAATRPSR